MESGMKSSLRTRIKRIENAMGSLNPNNLMRVTTIKLPNDVSDDTRDDMVEEAKATLPERDDLAKDYIVALRYVSGDGMPKGGTWSIVNSNVQRTAI